ncbi:MAG TPA: magnesium transporter CorA family protein [Candidatus Limnocylindrales bacterium]|nr:magnesium transporter CorA family protein [Candidatus Limnocylindrales bacterium]
MPSVRAWASRKGRLEELQGHEAIREAARDRHAQLWIDLTAPSPGELRAVADLLGLHPLIVEDISERNQRAKAEMTGEVLHIVMFGLRYDGKLERPEVDAVLGRRFLLTAHDADWQPDPAVARIGIETLLSGGPDYVLYAIVDWLVDGYLPVFDRIGDELDALEDEIVRRPEARQVERLFAVKRDLLEMRHAVSPQREVLNMLTTRDLPYVRPERVLYFRDVYDHLVRFTDELDTYRELASTALEAYLSTVNNNLSVVMKRLTAITAILAGVGAVAGIFGMSEATAAFQASEGPGFWLVAGGVLLVGAVVWVYFRAIDWI